MTMPPADIELASRIVSDLLNEPALEAVPITGRGDVNRVLRVTAGGRAVVVRLNDDDDTLDRFAKERWCMERAAEAGIPGPVVLAVGKRGDTGYMVLSFIPGDHGTESSLSPDQLWRTLGRYARRIHAIAATGCGENLTDPSAGAFGGFCPTWADHVAYNIRSLGPGDKFLELGVYAPADMDAIRRCFEGLLADKFTFGLVHADLSGRNVIVGPDGQVSVLDWGCAEVMPVPHHEFLLQMLEGQDGGHPDAGEFAAFLAGYGISRPEFEALLPEINAMWLLRSFDKLRWAIDRLPAERWASYADMARKTRISVLG